jgi:two-component system response regulator DesR
MRGALIALLDQEADIEVVGGLGCDDRIVPLAASLQTQVVVIDTDVAVSHLVPTLKELPARAPRCRVLILADPRKPIRLTWGSHTRSWSFLVKDAPPALLAGTIRRVAAGERVLDAQIAVSALVGAEQGLTSRELEVLALAAEGASVSEIANRMYLSLGTVRNYLSAVVTKTGARNRVDAIRIARQTGWL